jgi:hypothetical protein
MPNLVQPHERSTPFWKPLNLCVTVTNQFTVRLQTAIVKPQPRAPLATVAKELGPSRPITVTVPLVLPTRISQPEPPAPALWNAAALLQASQKIDQQIQILTPEGTTTVNCPSPIPNVNDPEHVAKTTIHRFTTPSTYLKYQGLHQAQPSHQLFRHTHTIIWSLSHRKQFKTMHPVDLHDGRSVNIIMSGLHFVRTHRYTRKRPYVVKQLFTKCSQRKMSLWITLMK